MSEVTKSNFKEMLVDIEKSLEKSVFSSIDCEFTGLVTDAKLKNSLFDTAEERYLKLKCSVEHFSVLQFGLSVFHYDRDGNRYIADVYSFYARPCSFGPLDPSYFTQASSLDFLTDHKFKFDKWAYDGIPFLNNKQEREIRSLLDAGTMFSNLDRSLSYRDEDELQAACSRVAQWRSSAALGDELTLQLDHARHCLVYFTHKEIRHRFQDVWTFSRPDEIVVRKMSTDDIKRASEAEGNQVDSDLLDSLLGLGKVFRLLVQQKKPIIGHNLLLDLMILYNLMYEPLPNTYKKFKKQLHELFPAIYDTKFISYRVKEWLKKGEGWESNALADLYVFLNSKGRLAAYSPRVTLMDDDPDNPITGIEENAHEAAWDAYMSGFCFTQLAHFMSLRRWKEDFVARPIVHVEHIAAMEEYKNKLNVIRGSVSHMNIGGPEPPSHRPQLLYMKRQDNQKLVLDQVTGMMATHGNVDVKALNDYSCLVAVPNKGSVRNILKMFALNKTYKVVPYSYLVHSALLNTVLWSVIIASGSCVTAYGVKTLLGK